MVVVRTACMARMSVHARQSACREEEKAREEAAVKELEELIATRMQRLAELVDEVARREGIETRTTSRLSSVRPAPSSLTQRLLGRRRRRGRRGGGESSTSLGSKSAAPFGSLLRGSRVVAGCCLRSTVDFWETTLLVYSRIQLYLVRQWTQAWLFSRTPARRTSDPDPEVDSSLCRRLLEEFHTFSS